MYESTERREAIALANRDRRKAGAAAGRPPKKRKKVNRFRVAVIAAGIIVVAAVAVSIVYAANAAGTGSGFLAISDGQPEFFSTIRPDAGEADGSTDSGAEDGAAASAASTSEFDGALFVGKDGAYRAEGLKVPVGSTVGAGDSMVAGFLHGLHLGEDLAGVFRRGVAAGTAAVTTEGTQLLMRKTYEEMLPRVEIREV